MSSFVCFPASLAFRAIRRIQNPAWTSLCSLADVSSSERVMDNGLGFFFCEEAQERAFSFTGEGHKHWRHTHGYTWQTLFGFAGQTCRVII
jgi:hypothetical protein